MRKNLSLRKSFRITHIKQKSKSFLNSSIFLTIGNVGNGLPESKKNKDKWRPKMGMYQQIRNLKKTASSQLNELNKERLVRWRKEPNSIRIERPTKLDRARSLGYRAKEGIIVVRQKILRSKRMRPKFKSGRRSKAMRRKKVVNKSYQSICEERVARKYVNCEVLNSYFVGKDGINIWYEVIVVDKNHPAIKKDKVLSWITKKNAKGRVFRGLTHSGKKSKIKT